MLASLTSCFTKHYDSPVIAEEILKIASFIYSECSSCDIISFLSHILRYPLSTSSLDIICSLLHSCLFSLSFPIINLSSLLYYLMSQSLSESNRESLSLLFTIPISFRSFSYHFAHFSEPLWISLLDSGFYTFLFESEAHLKESSRSQLWDLLCDCGEFAFQNRVAIKRIDRIGLSQAAERQEMHKRFNLALIPMCSERLRAEEVPSLWKIVFLAMNRSADMPFFESILLFLIEFARSSDLIDSFLSEVQSKHLVLPASVLSKLQSQSLSLHSRTVVLQLIYDGKQSDRPTSPTLRSSRFWKEEALDRLYIGGVPRELKGISIELRNKIDPLAQLVMTNQRASHCFHQIVAVLRVCDVSTQRSIVEYVLQIHESFPIRVVQLMNGSCIRIEDAVEMMRLLMTFHPYKTCSVLKQHDCLLTRDCFRSLQSQTCTSSLPYRS